MQNLNTRAKGCHSSSRRQDKKRSWVDLHLHSNHSDGLFTPEEIVTLAAKLDLRAISIVDHDDIGAIEAAIKRGQELNVEIIPGVELSTREENSEVHILGYFIDYRDTKILDYLDFFRQERYKRALKILEKLKRLGIALKVETVLQKAGPGSIGRPHIADAMLEEGYVYSFDEAFHKYIGDGRPAYVPKFKISPEKAIDLITSLGGLAFLAHPGIDLRNEEVLRLAKIGLDGIETVHPKHNLEKIRWLKQVSNQYELLESGGSDCHGNRKGQILMGNYSVPYDLVEKMKETLRKRSGGRQGDLSFSGRR